jgi:hypothetical protein
VALLRWFIDQLAGLAIHHAGPNHTVSSNSH